MCFQAPLEQGKILFTFAWGAQEPTKQCSHTSSFQKLLRESPPFQVSQGTKKFVQVGDRRYEYPLAPFTRNLLVRRKIPLETLQPFEAEDFDILWDVHDLGYYFVTNERWIGLLQDAKSHQVIAYANGSIISDSKHKSLEIQVNDVSTYPSKEYRGRGFCSLLMLHCFKEIHKRFPTAHVTLHNVAGEVGEKCYAGAARKNGYRVHCLDSDKGASCEMMKFEPP